MPVVDASVVVDLIAPDVGPDSPARALFAGWARSGAELLAPGLLWLSLVVVALVATGLAGLHRRDIG